jgi:hypothetical protein
MEETIELKDTKCNQEKYEQFIPLIKQVNHKANNFIIIT